MSGFQNAASLWASLLIGDVEYVREGTRLADLAILEPLSVIQVKEIRDEDPGNVGRCGGKWGPKLVIPGD